MKLEFRFSPYIQFRSPRIHFNHDTAVPRFTLNNVLSCQDCLNYELIQPTRKHRKGKMIFMVPEHGCKLGEMRYNHKLYVDEHPCQMYISTMALKKL